jgi:hypothetical protein
MGKVVWRGSMAGIFLYASVGIFGYLTFYNKPEELFKQNILLADYHMNIAVIIGQFTSFISVYAAMPLLYLPAKETVEELFMHGKRMTGKQNAYITLLLVVISYVFAIFVPSIGDAMALAGCTTNPMVSYPIFDDSSSPLDRFPYPSDHVLGHPQRQAPPLQGKDPLRRRLYHHRPHLHPRPHKFHHPEEPLSGRMMRTNDYA